MSYKVDKKVGVYFLIFQNVQDYSENRVKNKNKNIATKNALLFHEFRLGQQQKQLRIYAV